MPQFQEWEAFSASLTLRKRNILIAFVLCCCKSPTCVKQIIDVWLDIGLPGLPPKILTSKVQVGSGICLLKILPTLARFALWLIRCGIKY